MSQLANTKIEDLPLDVFGDTEIGGSTSYWEFKFRGVNLVKHIVANSSLDIPAAAEYLFHDLCVRIGEAIEETVDQLIRHPDRSLFIARYQELEKMNWPACDPEYMEAVSELENRLRLGQNEPAKPIASAAHG